MRFEIESPAEAERAIEYFNAFHDGFVKELRMTAHHSFPERGVQQIGGPPDLELVFAHYNYERDSRPPDQLVRATFRGVMGLETDLSGLATESSVHHLAIEGASRRLDDGAEERCLRASVFAPRLANGAWTRVEALRFTFERCVFEEI